VPKQPKRNWTVRRQIDVATFCGVSIDTVKSWAKQKMPGAPGAYDLPAIVQWLRTSGPWKQHARPEADDPLLGGDGGDSPGLERYRLAKAALAEFELANQTDALLSSEKARAVLGRWAAILRRLAERLTKRHGPAAASALNEALDQCQRVIDHDLPQYKPAQPAGDGGPTIDGRAGA
jgi:hypothetical protein